MGTIVTFYSFKGGIGRSMALANVGVLLAQWGYNVLAVDFDLEAPGLESFFQSFVDLQATRKRRGLVDFLGEYFENRTEDAVWKADPISIRLPRTPGRLALWTAGMRDEDYFKRVRRLDFPELYSSANGGAMIEELRSELKGQFDFVLIDSRTGLTDIGGVCTVQLPDAIVLLFTPTDQAFEGALDIVRRALIARQCLPFTRPVIPTIPIPSRFDTQAEFRLSQKWLDRFARDLQDLYSDWLPKSVKRRDLLELTKLPHVSYFTFGESLPVLEHGTTDPGVLGYAYGNLAALIAKNLQEVEVLMTSRDQYVRTAARQQTAGEAKEGSAKIFISYHHRDQKWLEQLRLHLAPLMKSRDLSVWDDSRIAPGSAWREEVQKAISEATVAVLLVSPDYLASEIILGEELPTLLRAAEERGLKITWIAVRPSLFEDSGIGRFQAAYDPSTPLSELNANQRDGAFVAIAKRISEVAGRAY